MRWHDQIEDPNGYYEFALEGRGLLFHCIVLAGFACLAVWPPFGFIFLRIIFALVSIHLSYMVIRDAKVSPMYAGPLVVVSPKGISLRGRWTLAWDQINRFESGRYGMAIFKETGGNWDDSILVTAISGPKLATALNARLQRLKVQPKMVSQP